MNALDERLRRDVLCDLINDNAATVETMSVYLISKRHIDEGFKVMRKAKMVLKVSVRFDDIMG